MMDRILSYYGVYIHDVVAICYKKKLGLNVFSHGCKHFNKVVAVFAGVFILALLYMQHTNKLNIERQSAVIDSLHEKKSLSGIRLLMNYTKMWTSKERLPKSG